MTSPLDQWEKMSDSELLDMLDRLHQGDQSDTTTAADSLQEIRAEVNTFIRFLSDHSVNVEPKVLEHLDDIQSDVLSISSNADNARIQAIDKRWIKVVYGNSETSRIAKVISALEIIDLCRGHIEAIETQKQEGRELSDVQLNGVAEVQKLIDQKTRRLRQDLLWEL